MVSIGTIHQGRLIKRGKQAVLFRKYDGFGVDRTALNYVNEVEVHYDKAIYLASVKDYLTHGIPWQTPGFEEQIILPREYFKKVIK